MHATLQDLCVMPGVDPGPLTWASLVEAWHLDPSSAAVVVLMAGTYALCYKRTRDHGGSVAPARAWCFGVGIALWALATISVVGAYAYVLFWMRALQVL